MKRQRMASGTRGLLGALMVLALAIQPLLGLMPLGAEEAGTKTIVDMAGRRVSVPNKVQRVFSFNPIGTVAVFTINPDKLAAINNKPGAEELKYLPKSYLDRPVWGMGAGGQGSINVETLIANHPDLIFSSPIDPSQIEASEKLQKATGIPVVMLDQNLETFPEFYRLIGSILGEEERAKTLADYAQRRLDEARALAKAHAGQGPRVYYAEGPDGLATDPAGSFHTQVLDILGAINVAKVAKTGVMGLTPVVVEDLVAWNPKIIIASSNNLAGVKSDLVQILRADARLASLDAIKNARVYRIPQGPFDWFDRPPSAARLIGLSWLGRLLYPDSAKGDFTKEVQEFYALFYRVSLSQAQVKEILGPGAP